MDKSIEQKDIRLSVPLLVLFFLILLGGAVQSTFASDLGLSEADCRCCHGESLADRHHLLVNTSGRECLSCHPLTLNPDTLSYDLTVTRDCLQCHTGSLADRHHLLVDQVTYTCFTCHAIVWDPNTLQYVADFNMACNATPQPVSAGTVSGNVTEPGGAGVGWVKVATSDGTYSTLATDTGSYELPDLVPGSYTLVATLDGYVGASQSVTVVDGQIHTVDFVLSPLPVPATINGVVRDTSQQPVEGASIQSADGVHSALSAADGSYNIGNVAEGSLDLNVHKEGFIDVSQAIDISAGQNLALDFVLNAAVEICTDGVDNDGNGSTDCDDPACVNSASCPVSTPEICDDGIDNDGNGLTDCEDLPCIGTGSCESPVVEICNDGFDNNGDGLLDCDDPLCSTTNYCLPELCSDGVDNNGDGLTDCSDPICADTSACRPPPVEICNDGLDNDANGLVDCNDSKCAALPSCTPPVAEELCTNGIDDNNDGDIDCADVQCQSRAVCLVEICDNGIDDDADGQVDCEESACRETTACSGNPGRYSLDFTAKASGSEDGYDAANAGDGDLSTRWWVDKNHRQWLMLDLGGRYPVDQVDIHWHAEYADEYKIRISKNRRYWKTVKAVENGTGGLESNTFNKHKARFILIECKHAASAGFSIDEVEVFRSADD